MKKIYLLCLSMLLLSGFATKVFAQKTVNGTVKDVSGPLPGVTISIKGSTKATQSDPNGKFSIVANPTDVLVFTFLGYQGLEQTVGSKTTFDIVLTASANDLNEVVVTALGVKRQSRALGYTVNTIASKELTKAGTTNFATAIYGKAPGVQVASAPGGATSAANISIRGFNSLTNNTQPLIVMDGVPIRNGEVNNNDYWGDQRIRGNGLLDINNEDIESLSILKGASASALYGSEAANGVILITTKSGKGKKGFSVDVNATYSSDNVAYLPRYQNVRGPGIDPFYSNAGQAADGFVYQDLDGNGSKETRGVGGFSINFGPLFDGKPTLAWDGQIRPYEAQIDNYKRFFQTGMSSNANVAISHATDNSNVRVSLTRQDNKGVSLGSKNEKNIVNFNGSFKLGSKFTTDVTAYYTNQYTHNRPYMVDRMINNFTGMIGRFDNPDWYYNRYKTSRGYKFVTGTNQSLTPSENIIYPGFKADIGDFVWNVKENQDDEYSDRLIATLTNTWSIIDDLKLRGRVSSDITSMRTTSANPNSIPLVFGNSGYFGLANYNSKILYGDLLLTYNKKVSKDLTITATGGLTGTRELYTNVGRGTTTGLSIENMFDISASVDMAGSNSYRRKLVKSAYLATLSTNYKDYLFIEGNLRGDKISTMNPNNNSFVYPSVNAGFIFSDAFKLPSVISYGKLRSSWGIVGNYPGIYVANVAYTQSTLGVQGAGSSVLYSYIPQSYGNLQIENEKKKEFELGLELKFFKGRLGLDAAYYDAKLEDQILPLTLPASSGATSILANVGSLRNKGIEIALTGAIFTGQGFNWNSTLNFARNRNAVEKLANGATELLHADYDGNAAQLKSIVGQPMGDIYVHPIAKDPNGNNIVNADGLYKLDANVMVKAGNAMPKFTGGFINNFTYKNFSLDVTMDFRYGGSVMPTGINWMISRGLLEESLNYMDASRGGLSYYRDATGRGIQTNSAQGPGGEKVYHDGMLMGGVLENGQPNTNVISQAYYYWNTYNWGGPQYSSSRYELYVKKNSYVKMREISFGYQLPKSLAGKVGAKNVQLSVFGRNLFYIYRTLKDLDPEQLTAGSRWTQTLTNAGSNPATRTFGAMLRASF